MYTVHHCISGQYLYLEKDFYYPNPEDQNENQAHVGTEWRKRKGTGRCFYSLNDII